MVWITKGGPTDTLGGAEGITQGETSGDPLRRLLGHLYQVAAAWSNPRPTEGFTLGVINLGFPNGLDTQRPTI